MFRAVSISFVMRNLRFDLDQASPLYWLHDLVVLLLQKWPCYIEGQQVPTELQLLNEQVMDEFVRDTLLDPRRVLPAIIFDCDMTLTDQALSSFHRQMLGFAQVAAIQNVPGTMRLNHLIGPVLTCAGGVRVYWPGFSTKSAAAAHHYYNFASIYQDTVPLSQRIYEMLSYISAERHFEGRVIRAARAALCGDEAELRILTGQATAETRLQTAVRERDAIGEECSSLRQSLQSSQREFKSMVADRDRCLKDRARAMHNVERLEATCDELRKKIKTQHVEAAIKLRAQNKPVKKEERNIRELRQEADELRAQRERIRKERDEAQEQVRSLEAELAAVRAELRALGNPEPLQSMEHGAEAWQELSAELEQAWDQNKRLQEEWDRERRRVFELEAKLENYQEQLSALFRDGPDDRECQPDQSPVVELAFASVTDALQAAASEFSDVLTVRDDAWESAEASRYVSPANVYRALRAIAEVGRDYFAALCGKPSAGASNMVPSDLSTAGRGPAFMTRPKLWLFAYRSSRVTLADKPLVCCR